MKILIATDFRAVSCDGKIYLASQHYFIVKRYKDAFGSVILCSRSVNDAELKDLYDATDMLEDFEGCRDLMDSMSGTYRAKLTEQIRQCDLVVGRFHSIMAPVAAKIAKKYHKPFFAELMGDAWDAYWNHGITGKVIAPYMFLKTKQVVKNADYALYVTREFLQKRYPCKNESVGVSNVLIARVDEAVLAKRLARIAAMDKTRITLMTTAAVDVRYKGQEYVIRAIPLLNQAGVRVRYVLVGGGKEDFLRSVAKKCGVEDQVEFAGRQPLDCVFHMLDEADIYVQPSLQEGLPRSVIEAMSRGCPAIGARTAGIPELIAPECVVRRKSVKEIVETILWISNGENMERLAKENFAHAGEYLDEVLKAKRNTYYEKIKYELAP